MPRSELARDRLSTIDWRGWLALAWVSWFGVLYGKMVIEQRGGKIRDVMPVLSARPVEDDRTR